MQKRHAYTCIFFISLILLCPFIALEAQKIKTESQSSGELEGARKLTYSVTILSGFCKKASVEKMTGIYEVSTSPQPIWGLGVNCLMTIKPGLFFLTGLHVSALGRNAVFDVPVKEINPFGYSEPYPPLKSNGHSIVLTVPLAIQKRWNLNRTNYIDAIGGTNIQYALNEDLIEYDHFFTDANNQNINVFHLSINSNNERKPWIGLLLGGGVGSLLKNSNTVSVRIFAHLFPADFVKGNYQIIIPNKPATTGTYTVKGSYIALGFSYSFSSSNKKF